MTTCATCRHWRGDASAYRAPCALPENVVGAVTFDFGCGRWEARADGPTMPSPSPLDVAKAVHDVADAYTALHRKILSRR